MDRKKIIRQYDKIHNLYLEKIEFQRFRNEHPIEYKLLQNNRQYYNLHKGERCFVLGNGPSLKQIDLASLKNEWTFSVNEMFRHSQYLEAEINYHFIADPYYFQLRHSNPVERKLLELLLEKGADKRAPHFFFPVESRAYIRKNRIDRKLSCSYFDSRLEFYDDYEGKIDFAKYVPYFRAVVQWAIAMAIYMGFEKIYLLGCDATNLIIDLQAFQGTVWGEKYAFDVDCDTEKAQKGVYLKQGIWNILDGYNRIFKIFDEMNKYCVRNHIKLINCSAETIIDSIPQKRFEDVI